MKDIKIKTDIEKFKYRVNGIIIKDNKILTLKMSNNISYCLPGGHIELGENSKTATIREMLEETEIKVTIEKELAFVESFYLDKNKLNTHEICFYYIVKPEHLNKLNLQNHITVENDKGDLKEHRLEWLDLSLLEHFDFRPKFIKEKLLNKDFNFEHIISKNIDN